MKYAQFENLFYQVFRPNTTYMNVNTGSVDYGEDWCQDVHDSLTFELREEILQKKDIGKYLENLRRKILFEVEEDENGDWVEA